MGNQLINRLISFLFYLIKRLFKLFRFACGAPIFFISSVKDIWKERAKWNDFHKKGESHLGGKNKAKCTS
ncbi:hypothetical protein CJ195_00160 [Bacillus sp. UMB0899]|nr:hypothetical protein CJ195_00160 [Bacillus sp. UMB0899]